MYVCCVCYQPFCFHVFIYTLLLFDWCLFSPKPADGGNSVAQGMGVERCCDLMVVAMANRLHEVWISPNAVLLFTYVSQFMPATSKWLVCVCVCVCVYVCVYVTLFYCKPRVNIQYTYL